MEYYFESKRMTVGYDGRPLIKDIDISLEKGHILTLIGPNGAGKSTIIKTIIRQLARIGGIVYIDGKNLDSVDASDMSKKVSVMLTQRLRTDRMTCEDVVESGRYPYTGRLGILSEEDHRKVREAMELTHTYDMKDRDFMRISDGQRQRLLLARAIAQEPELLVLDEPTSFLDVRYKLELLNILRDLARDKGITVIMSMHELDLAQRISDEVMCVKGEYISAYGTASEIFDREHIVDLYDLDTGSYDPLFGSLEMKRIEGEPEVFVIAGGGTGIGVFRILQKRGIPFAAGILHRGDVDSQVAEELAADVIFEKAFSPISDDSWNKAMSIMKNCKYYINCLEEYGEINSRNRDLAEEASKAGLKEIKKEELR